MFFSWYRSEGIVTMLDIGTMLGTGTVNKTTKNYLRRSLERLGQFVCGTLNGSRASLKKQFGLHKKTMIGLNLKSIKNRPRDF